jgi:hypothetical protein
MEELMERVTEQAQNVAHDVREQAENVASEWRVQMSERSIQMRDRGVSKLRGLATELRQMAAVPTGSSTTAHELARIAADRLDVICAELEQRDPGDMMIQARSYARSHPAQVTAGMFATGLLVGRMLRGSRSTQHRTIDVREGYRPSGTGYSETGYIQ